MATMPELSPIGRSADLSDKVRPGMGATSSPKSPDVITHPALASQIPPNSMASLLMNPSSLPLIGGSEQRILDPTRPPGLPFPATGIPGFPGEIPIPGASSPEAALYYSALASGMKTDGRPYPFNQQMCVSSPYDLHGYPYLSNTYTVLDPRRKNATKESTNTLKAWLYEHKKNPYPTKGEKIMLAILTRMTLTQVSTWFANARRRLKKESKVNWPEGHSSDDEEGQDEEEEEKERTDDPLNRKDHTIIPAQRPASNSSQGASSPPVVPITPPPSPPESSTHQPTAKKSETHPRPPKTHTIDHRPAPPNPPQKKPGIWSIADMVSNDKPKEAALPLPTQYPRQPFTMPVRTATSAATSAPYPPGPYALRAAMMSAPHSVDSRFPFQFHPGPSLHANIPHSSRPL